MFDNFDSVADDSPTKGDSLSFSAGKRDIAPNIFAAEKNKVIFDYHDFFRDISAKRNLKEEIRVTNHFEIDIIFELIWPSFCLCGRRRKGRGFQSV